MSSLPRGATGAARPKPLNVNSIYSGRNLAAGQRPFGKHGMLSVGKSVGVVRRMPPPATLPSLKAENNGQDPTIAVVPQGGTGWNKNEPNVAPAAPTTQKPASNVLVQPSNGPDLRPTWAKPATESAPQSSSSNASAREFPTLSSSAQSKEDALKPQNKWATGTLPHQTGELQGSVGSSGDRQLPSRYYDGGQQTTKPAQGQAYMSRFQGSSDARSSQPSYFASKRASECENDAPPYSLRQDSDRSSQLSENYSSENVRFFGGSDDVRRATPPTAGARYNSANYDGNDRYDDNAARSYDREAAIERSRQKRTAYRTNTGSSTEEVRRDEPAKNAIKEENAAPAVAPAVPQPEYRLLKRPEKKLELEDVSDDDEDVQMTKLNKPAVKVIKRVANGQADEPEAQDSSKQAEKKSERKSPAQNNGGSRSQTQQKSGDIPQVFKKTDKPRAREVPVPKGAAPTELEKEEAKASATAEEVILPAPAPSENVWAKRKEERESQERDQRARMPKSMQKAIEQHFPSVAEAAAIKVDKDQARKPADADFARAAMRARRQPDSNDVRQIMGMRDEHYERPSYTQQAPQQRVDYQRRQQRDYRDPREQREPRDYRDQREPRERDQEEEAGRDNRDREEQQTRYKDHSRSYNNNYNNRGGDRDHREHRERDDNDYGEDEQYNGGQREFVNSRVASGVRRGLSTRGRGVRGGRGRIGYSSAPPVHQHYQIQRRPYVPKPRPEEQEEDESKTTDPVNELEAASDSSIKDTVPVEKMEKLTVDTASEREGKETEGGDASSPPEEIVEGEQKSGYQPRHNTRGRWQSRGSAVRGGRGGEVRRGGRGGSYSYYGRSDEERPRRHRNPEEEGEEGGQPGATYTKTGRGGYTQRIRRGQNKEQRGPPRHHREGDESHANDRADRLKSPVVSSEGHDEWETASESSGRVRSSDKEVAPARRMPSTRQGYIQSRRGGRGAGTGAVQHNGDGPHTNERIRSKNGQPASRTYRSPSESSNNKRDQRQKRHHSADRIGAADGLAGLDNNALGEKAQSGETAEEFEEVMDKRTKKQKALELQQRLEAEERRKQREKERTEKMQARKAAKLQAKKDAQAQAIAKKQEEKSRKELADIGESKSEREDREQSHESIVSAKEEAITKKEIPVTTVWNSAHVAAMEKGVSQELPSVIPSPIARPTPRCKSAASDTPPATKEETRERLVELPLHISSSQPIRTDKYEFAFDPQLHEASLREQEKEREREREKALALAHNTSTALSTDADHLLQRLGKVKGIWNGEDVSMTTSNGPALPSNVAKVKPQPQVGGGGEAPSPDERTDDSSCNTTRQPMQTRMPGIGPFSSGLNMFNQYPMMLGDMSGGQVGGFMPQGHGASPALLPPPNATSPPMALMGAGPTGPYGQPMQPTGIRSAAPAPRNYMDQNMFMNPRNMTWCPPNASASHLDVSMGFGSTPQPPMQQQQAQPQQQVGPTIQQQQQQQQQGQNGPNGPMQTSGYQFAGQQMRTAPHTQPMQQHRSFPNSGHGGPAGNQQTQQQQPPQHKMMGMMGSGGFTPDMTHCPPPPSHGPVGSQRPDRYTNAPTQPMAPHGHNAYGNMQPPTGNVPPQFNMNQPPPAPHRFSQPPPSMGGLGQDMTWGSKSIIPPGHAPPPQMQQFGYPGQMGMSRSGGPDPWAMNHQQQSGMGGQHIQQHMNNHNQYGMPGGPSRGRMPMQHDRDDLSSMKSQHQKNNDATQA